MKILIYFTNLNNAEKKVLYLLNTCTHILGIQQEDAANALAAEAHRVVEFHKEIREDVPQLPEVDCKLFDATAEYIGGDTIFTNFPRITSTSLDRVAVLIGLVGCILLLGIISQPFRNKVEENNYTSSLYEGITHKSMIL
uniref:Uncharacterized protein n=1 Tax=Glossina pallidipes TaxID=7398 RepID=A0A1B0ACD8_GLOPL